MTNEKKTDEIKEEKSLGLVEWISLVVSIITISTFVVGIVAKVALSEVTISLAGVAGTFWIGSLVRKMSVTINELRFVRQEIITIQNIKFKAHIEEKGTLIIAPDQQTKQELDESTGKVVDQSAGKKEYHGHFESGGGEQNIG